MADLETTIQQLEAKLRQAKAKKAQIDAKKRASDAKKQRQEDTRRKIIAGAVVLDAIQKYTPLKTLFLQLLHEELKRPSDRALFNLDGEVRTELHSEQLDAVKKYLRENAESKGIKGFDIKVEHVVAPSDPGSARLEYTATRE